MVLLSALALSCAVIDGDTIRCGTERIRLSGIDAPETSACRPGRRCVEGDGRAARKALDIILRQGDLRMERLGRDRYGRTIAAVYAGGRNVACSMIANGHAVYRKDWDNRGLVARDCRI